MEVVEGTESGIILPDMFLMKICKESSDSDEDEEMEETLLERILESIFGVVVWCGVVR